jgi:hypothetical protein
MREKKIVNHIDFKYELPNGLELLVEATITPGVPMKPPSLDGPGEPPEHPSAEVGDVYLMVDMLIGPAFDPDDIYLRVGTPNVVNPQLKELTEILEDEALDQWENQE